MKLLLVEWVDSHSGRGWRSLDDIERLGGVLRCCTVGWLVSKTKDVTVLASSVYDERQTEIEQHGCGDMSIPNRCITKTTVLRK